jgi:dUTP pyrophosphatase
LRAAIDKSVIVLPYSDCDFSNTYVKIPFGIKIQPSHEDMYVEIFNRSGLSCKHGVSIRNAVGIIDYGYRKELMGFYKNISRRPYTIQPGERVAQMVLKQRMDVKLVTVDHVKDTGRGGFGSTGRN